jgi:hypothetical protein
MKPRGPPQNPIEIQNCLWPSLAVGFAASASATLRLLPSTPGTRCASKRRGSARRKVLQSFHAGPALTAHDFRAGRRLIGDCLPDPGPFAVEIPLIGNRSVAGEASRDKDFQEAPEDQETAYRTFPLRPVWQPGHEWVRPRGEAQGWAREMGHGLRRVAIVRESGPCQNWGCRPKQHGGNLCRSLCRNHAIPTRLTRSRLVSLANR